MLEPISWSTLFTALKTGNTVLDDNKRAALIRVLLRLIYSKRKIVVFGLSGAGKSQFIRCLKNNLAIAERTDATEKIRFNLEEFPIQFVDTPGQQGRRHARLQEITAILKDGVAGIINVVGYGYEENPERSPEMIFTPENEVKESFLKANRKAEVERLVEWLPLIQPKQVGWIINLVNKADLWWDDKQNVEKHYSEGEYNDAFKEVSQYINVMTLPFCSIIKPYYGYATSGKFGELDKMTMYGHFIHQLLNLLKGSIGK